MKYSSRIVLASLIGLGLVAGTVAMTRPVPTAPAAVAAGALALSSPHFEVDSVHSFIIFKINHLGMSNTYGRINGPTGHFLLDSASPESSVIDISVKTDDVDTANAKRDQHLKSPDFFNAKEFPTISFKSKSVKKTGDKTFEATGDVTLHGQTKPLTVTITKVGEGAGMQPGTTVAGFETTFTVKRSDFGMSFMTGKIGDDVTVTVAVEGGHS